jgi:hypothetical protein
VAKEKYDTQYEEFLSASQKFHMYFLGGAVEKKENDAEFAEFIGNLSRDSLQHQQAQKVYKLRPPFIAWVGEPKHLSGERQGLATFYENFNFVIGYLNKDTPDLPLHELCNHNFHAIVVRATSVEDLEFLNGKKLRANDITIIDDNDEPNEDLQIICMKNGFRYFVKGDRIAQAILK